MTCLLKTEENRKLVKKYADVLGSEAAAYYVLCCNNGWEFDKDLNGNPSLLWEQLLEHYDGDYKEAIRAKAATFSDSFVSQFGDWFNRNENPTIIDIYEPNVIDVKDYLGEFDEQGVKTEDVYKEILEDASFKYMTDELAKAGIEDKQYVARQCMEQAKQEYIDQSVNKFTNKYPEKALSNRFKKFFRKVVFFWSKKRRINDPYKKKTNEVRAQAAHEFYETVRYNIIQKLTGYISAHDIELANKINQLYDKEFDLETKNEILVTYLNILSNLIIHGDYDISQNKSQVKGKLLEDIVGNCEQYLRQLDNKEVLLDILNMYFALDDKYIDYDRDAINVMTSSTQSRIMSAQRHAGQNKSVILKLKTKLAKLEKVNAHDLKEIHKTWIDFLYDSQSDLLNCLKWIKDVKEKGIEKLDLRTLSYIQTDVIGHYQYMFDTYLQMLESQSNMTKEQIDELKQIYESEVKRWYDFAKSEYNNLLYEYMDRYYLQKWVEENVDLGDKERFLINMRYWLHSKIDNGEVQSCETFCGMASCSRSPIVRMFANMYENQLNKQNKQTQKKGNHLVTLFKKCKAKSKDFAEFTSDGQPSGNLIRDINYGEHQFKLQQFKDKYARSHKLMYDDNGNPIFNLNTKKGEDAYNEYMDALDDWHDKYTNRRFTGEYYKARRRYLSRDTIQLLDSIQSKIQVYLDACTDRETGVIDITNLKPEELQQYQALLQEKKQIASPYYITVNEDTGEIETIETKTGDEARMAKELMEWYEFTKDKVTYKPDEQAFYEALNQISDPERRQQFIEQNSRVEIDPIFYEQIESIFGETQLTEDAKQARYNKSKLLNYVATNDLSYDLLDFNDEAWKEIKQQEEEYNSGIFRNEVSPEQVEEFQKIAKKVPIMTYQNGKYTPVIQYLYEKAKEEQLTNPNAINEFYDKYYIVANGKSRPLSCFYKLEPTNPRLKKRVPTGHFSKVDPSCYFANPEFKEGTGISYQPKDEYFHNDKYDKLMAKKGAKEVYEEILRMNHEANSYYPKTANTDDYRLCQIGEREGKYIWRNAVRGNLGQATANVMKRWTSATEKDTEFNEDFHVRPDGTRVSNVPIRFVNRLQDRSLINTDVIGTTVIYYDHALGFDLKSKIMPVGEALLSEMQGGIDGKVNNSQIKRFKQYMDMYIYGRENVGFNGASQKMSEQQQRTQKILNSVRRNSVKAMLSNKLYPMTKGFVSANVNVWVSAFSCRHFTRQDLAWGLWYILKDTWRNISSIGKPNTNSKVQSLMQYFGQSKSVMSIYGKQDLNRFVRIVYDNYGMGGYQLADYMTTSSVLVAVMKNHRLVYNPLTGEKQFMNDSEARDVYEKAGAKNGRKAWKDAKISMLDVYSIDEEGVPYVKAEYKQYVTEKVENRIANTTRERSAIINGIVPDTGKSFVYMNAYTRFFTVLRGYLFSTGWDLFKNSYDYSDYDPEKFTDKMKLKWTERMSTHSGQYNFNTGRIERGMFRNLAGLLMRVCIHLNKNMKELCKFLFHTKQGKAQWDKLSDTDRGQIRQLIGTFTAVILAGYSACALFIPMAEDDPDSWWKNFVALTAVGVTAELATPISPFTVSDVLTQITSSYSYLQMIGKVGELLLITLGLTDESVDDIIESGVYKGYTKGEKIFLRSTKQFGLSNIIETFTPQYNHRTKQYEITPQGIQATRNYYMNNVFPLPYIKKFAQDIIDDNVIQKGSSTDVPPVDVPYVDVPYVDVPPVDI